MEAKVPVLVGGALDPSEEGALDPSDEGAS